MYTIDNGMALAKRKENWIFLLKYLKNKKFPIEDSEVDPVVHQAPNAAYNLLKKFYCVLEKKEFIDDEPGSVQIALEEEYQEPDYAKATIAKKMKDNELVRIVDNKRMTNKAKEIISDHNNFMRSDRMSRPERY